PRFCDVTDANAPEADTRVDTSPRSTRDVGGAEVDEPHADTPTTTNTSDAAAAMRTPDLPGTLVRFIDVLPFRGCGTALFRGCGEQCESRSQSSLGSVARAPALASPLDKLTA
ncbi:MAG TPA: hypothetical protein VGM75_37375, partial [Pseudonocardiaceae bacterium]